MGRTLKTLFASRPMPSGWLWLALAAAWLVGLVSALLLGPVSAAILITAGIALVGAMGFGPIRKAFVSEQRKINLLLNAVPEGILEIDAAGTIVFVNPQLCDLFGYTTEELLGKPLEVLVPPGARDGHAARRQSFWHSARSRPMGSGMDITGIRKNGSLVPVDISLSRLETHRGTAIYCMVRDNSARKAFERQLLENNRRLTDSVAALERHSRELQALTDMGELLHSSASERELYGIVARTIARLLPDFSGALYVLKEQRGTADKVVSWGVEGDALRGLAGTSDCWALRRGRTHASLSPADHPRCEHGTRGEPRLGCCVPLLGHGELLGVLHLGTASLGAAEAAASRLHLLNAIANQVALSLANLRLRDKLLEQSHIDPLTGLYNRRAIDEHFEEGVRRALAESREIALLALDIDHFKSFNDRHGHDGGDVALREVGTLLRRTLRHGDVLCRFGGEEFAVLLPETTSAEAEVVAEKLRTAVEAMPLHREGRSLGHVSVSIGVAVLDVQGDTLSALMRRADRALYRAKSGGRNRVAVSRQDDATGMHRPVPAIPRQA